MPADVRSVTGKHLDISEDFDILVVGGGPAGTAAAIEARKYDLTVLLVDENPVSFEDMCETIPLHYGGRMSAVVRNRNAMTEAMIASRPDIVEAFEAGVDVRLSTACVGLHVNQANLHWMDGNIATLVDADRGSYLTRFRQAIVASGRRDMGLAFSGWEQLGVMGSTAAYSLATTYNALDTTRAVMLGSTVEAALDALRLAQSGVEIVAIVEAASVAACGERLEQQLKDMNIPILLGDAVTEATGDALHGVSRLRLKSGKVLEADTIVLAIGAIPMVDILGAAGCRLVFDASRGGYVPEVQPMSATSLSAIRVAGDCAGIWPEKSLDMEISRREGRSAAGAAALALGRDVDPHAVLPIQCGKSAFDLDSYRKTWVAMTILDTGGDVHVCQCEEVTAREIVGVEPPRYLEWTRKKNTSCSLRTLIENAAPHPDQIKRLTRAGMGPCQGRRCREQVQVLLALESHCAIKDVALASYRAPVRPVPLAAAAPLPDIEDPVIREQWDSWFGMPRQWVPYWSVDEEYTVASLANVKEHVVE